MISSEQVARLAGLIGSEAMSAGKLAVLRRLDPTKVLPPEAWHLLGEFGLENDDAERAVAGLSSLMALARMSGPALPIGQALGERPGDDAKYAEIRFVRLLRARGLSELMHEARQAIKWCVTHGRRIDFTGYNGFAAFILAAAIDTQASRVDAIAHSIARDYFRRSEDDNTKPESK